MRFVSAALSFAALPSLALAQGKFVNITTAELACLSNCTLRIAANETREIRTCKHQTIFDDPECFYPFRHNGAVLNAPEVKLGSFVIGAGSIFASVLLA